MKIYNELQLAKELIRYPSITPVDAGVMRFLAKKLSVIGFKCKVLEFKTKGYKPVKNLYARLNKSGLILVLLVTLMLFRLVIKKIGL